MQEYKVTVDTTGTIRFYKPNSNELHRIDGPAVEYANDDKSWYRITPEYWIDGKQLSEEQFKKKTAPAKEMTIAEIEALLGHSVKIVK